MNIPNLMPFQMESFNGDHFVREEFIKIKEKFNVKNVVETGTCLGSTTMFFSENFDNVFSVEINDTYLQIAKERNPNANYYLGSSDILLPSIIENLIGKTIFFLDAHWENHCPLLAELDCISKMADKPIIVVHDFFVPNSNLGYDAYNGQVFNFEWIKPKLDLVYGIDNYDYYYNSNETSTEVKRGLIYIIPKMEFKYLNTNSKKTNLITNYYTSELPERQDELETCLFKNIQNSQIDTIILFTNEVPKQKSEKIVVICGNDRPTYNQLFKYINDNYPNDYNIIANSDIYFEDLSYIKNLAEDSVFALTRYNVDINGVATFWNTPDSQDVWIFNGKIKEVIDCDFSLGIGGCDNAIAERMQRSGIDVKNPSLKLKTFHLHNTNFRTYDGKNPIPQPYFYPKIY
jgi:hypothetical protein